MLAVLFCGISETLSSALFIKYNNTLQTMLNLILYPSLGKLTTHITIAERLMTFFLLSLMRKYLNRRKILFQFASFKKLQIGGITNIVLVSRHQRHLGKKHRTNGFPQYIYQNSQLLAPVICFAKLAETGLWAVGQSNMHLFLIFAQTSQKRI